MNTDRLRGIFADFLASHNIDNALRHDSCCTINQDSSLKYERIDRYRILFMTWEELKSIFDFCAKHEISAWFGLEKLCIGYNYRSNMRLSAYSVPLRELAGNPDKDIIKEKAYEETVRETFGQRVVDKVNALPECNSVPPEISADPSQGDRTEVGV